MNIAKTDDAISNEARHLLRKLYSGYSIETTPRWDEKIDSYKAILPKSTTVMIASLHGGNFKEIIRTAKRLRQEGMEPVPHIAARSIPNLACLETRLDELQSEADVNHMLVLGGDIPSPVGPYHSSMDILNLGVFEKRGINKIGVSGHPEGSSHISDSELSNAIRWKNEYASRTGCDVYICTQFVFEALPVISWERKIRNEGNQLPIKLGVPGIASLRTLIRHAAAAGIGQSVRFLTQQAPHIKNIMTFNTPEKLLKDLANHYTQESSSLIEGIHFFPFGGVEKTSRWVAAQLGTEYRE